MTRITPIPFGKPGKDDDGLTSNSDAGLSTYGKGLDPCCYELSTTSFAFVRPADL